MGRITPESFTGIAGNIGAGLDAGNTDSRTGGGGQVDQHEGLGGLFDLLDRVDRHSQRPIATAAAAATAAAKKKDPTELPSAAERAKSFAAIAAAGFTDVHLKPVPYFNQGIGEWASHPYPRTPAVPGESRTIEQAGCAPTALAMVDCGLRDAHMRPEAAADFAVRQGVSGSPRVAGSNTGGLAHEWADRHGLGLTAATSSHQSRNVDVLKAGLLANGIALVSVGVDPSTHRGHFTSGGHVMVINGCAMRGGEEWFAIANPGRANQADARNHPRLLTTDANVTQIGGAHHGVGQVWISRKQLEAEMKSCFVFRSGVES